MDVVRDEVNAFLLSSSTSASDLSHRSSSNRAEGYAKLLRAASLDEGVEEVGSG